MRTLASNNVIMWARSSAFILSTCLARAILVPMISGNSTSARNEHLQLDAGDNSMACSNKGNLALVNAIGLFCARDRPNVQSMGTYRTMSDKEWKFEGIQWGIQVLWVCGESPGKGGNQATEAGEISDEMCFSNWWAMCAEGDRFGGGITVNFGDLGCQEWTISTLNVVHSGYKSLYWGPFLPGGGDLGGEEGVDVPP